MRLAAEVVLHVLTGAIVSWIAISYGWPRSEPQAGIAQAAKAGLAARLAEADPALARSPARSPASSPASPKPASSQPPDTAQLLSESWAAYRRQFIQADGRVIDRESRDRTVSEGQAYAMLRAVFANDRTTFALTLNWAEANLQRRQLPPNQPTPTPPAAPPAAAQQNPSAASAPNSTLNPGDPLDSLWAWKWGQRDSTDWGILDHNFASDADLDAVTALILASRRWNRPAYLALARTKLKDLWDYSTVVAPASADSRPQRYFLPGPLASFQPAPNQIYLNPSYLAPYAFRLFAQVDPSRDWLSLVESSYQVLTDSAQLSQVKLPSDWVVFDLKTKQFSPASAPLQSLYSFDAFRVWWRVALDAAWFDEPRAKAYLNQHLVHLQQLWRTERRIPARIDLSGAATVSYEATSQYAMLYPALLVIDPAMAAELLQQKLLPAYKNGIWDNDRAYYTQNLVGLGLYPAAKNRRQLRIQPTNLDAATAGQRRRATRPIDK